MSLPILKIGNNVNALVDTDPDRFSLYFDGLTNLYLAKQYESKITDVGASTTKNVNHALGYIPFCMVFKLESNVVWRKMFGRPIDSSGCYFTVDKQNVSITNGTGSPVTFKYFIFYDNIRS